MHRGAHEPILKPLGMIKSGPTAELSSAARNGPPNLQPQSDTMSAADLLTGGGQTKIGELGSYDGNSSHGVARRNQHGRNDAWL